jgi:hypothetical protein
LDRTNPSFQQVRRPDELPSAIPKEGSPVFLLKEDVTLTTNQPWVNPIPVWAPGTVDVSKGEIRIKAYTS